MGDRVSRKKIKSNNGGKILGPYLPHTNVMMGKPLMGCQTYEKSVGVGIRRKAGLRVGEKYVNVGSLFNGPGHLGSQPVSKFKC